MIGICFLPSEFKINFPPSFLDKMSSLVSPLLSHQHPSPSPWEQQAYCYWLFGYKNAPYKHLCLHAWPPLGDTVWGGSRAFGRWSLDGGSGSLWVGLKVSNLTPPLFLDLQRYGQAAAYHSCQHSFQMLLSPRFLHRGGLYSRVMSPNKPFLS